VTSSANFIEWVVYNQQMQKISLNIVG